MSEWWLYETIFNHFADDWGWTNWSIMSWIDIILLGLDILGQNSTWLYRCQCGTALEAWHGVWLPQEVNSSFLKEAKMDCPQHFWLNLAANASDWSHIGLHHYLGWGCFYNFNQLFNYPQLNIRQDSGVLNWCVNCRISMFCLLSAVYGALHGFNSVLQPCQDGRSTFRYVWCCYQYAHSSLNQRWSPCWIIMIVWGICRPCNWKFTELWFMCQIY